MMSMNLSSTPNLNVKSTTYSCIITEIGKVKLYNYWKY